MILCENMLSLFIIGCDVGSLDSPLNYYIIIWVETFYLRN